MKVLVVGADRRHQGLVRVLAELYGAAAVHTVGSIGEALAYLAEGRPDLVLLDAELPGMEHFAAVSQVLRQRPDIPLAVIAPPTDRASFLAAVRQGARGLIPASPTPEALRRAVTVIRSGDLLVPATPDGA